PTENSQVQGPPVRNVEQGPGYSLGGHDQLAVAVVESGLQVIGLVQVHDADLVQFQHRPGGVRKAGSGLGFHGLRSSCSLIRPDTVRHPTRNRASTAYAMMTMIMACPPAWRR